MGVIQIDWHCECGDGPASHYTRPDGEVCYGWCQQTDHDCNGMGYRPINHTRRPPAFAAMLEVLWNDGFKDENERWPKRFTVDISSDYKTILTLDEGQPFIWVVREDGTHLLTLDRESIGFTEQAARYFERQERVRFYVWNGWDKLTRVTSDHIRETVKAAIESHANEDMAYMTERQWSNEVR